MKSTKKRAYGPTEWFNEWKYAIVDEDGKVVTSHHGIELKFRSKEAIKLFLNSSHGWMYNQCKIVKRKRK